MDNQKWRPGEEAPASGTYAAYDANGQCGGAVYLEEGNAFLLLNTKVATTKNKTKKRCEFRTFFIIKIFILLFYLNQFFVD